MNKIDQKVHDILSKMSLREKIGQSVMIEPFFLYQKLRGQDIKHYRDLLDPTFLDQILDEYKIGFLFFGGVSTLGEDLTEHWAQFIKEVNEYARNKGVKIPLFYGSDAVHGVNFIKKSTIYTHNLAVASTWNVDLAERYTRAVGKELAAMGMNVNFAPTIDIARDHRWGRVYESLGEDAYLASKFSQAFIRGFQKDNQIAACAKHFLGYGESSNGMDRTPANLSERSILENHLPPFEAAINAGVKMVMVNGGDVNGVPMPASKKYIKKLLKKQLNFQGAVMSDWEDVVRLKDRHHIARSKKEAILKAFSAGVDLNMAVTDFETIHIIEELVEEGAISMEQIDDMAKRIIQIKVELSMFENDDIDVEEAVKLCNNESSRALAKELALESFTLLKNKDKILPLSKDIKSILVTGKTANTKGHLCGGWTLGWDKAKEEDLFFETILQALMKRYPNIDIVYAEDVFDIDAIDFKQKDFDLCLSVVGETPHAEWLGDSFDLSIEEKELSLLKTAHATKLPIVMLSLIARPVDMVWAHEHVDAILWAYNPGSEGAHAIVDVLFGDFNPSGKLAMTFPKNANQIPIIYNARKYISRDITTKYDPLYPFGYGLSYTSFKYDHLKVPKQVKQGEDLLVSVDVSNMGDCPGQEVVQVYIEDQYASVTRPLKSLKAFKKIYLKVNQSKIVHFTLTRDDLSFYDENLEWVEEKRVIDIYIGDLKKSVEII